MDHSPPVKSTDIVLQLALRAGGVGIWDWNLKTNEFEYSDRARAIFGFPSEGPVTYEMVKAATHPEDFPFTSAQATRALDHTKRENAPYEYRAIRADTGEQIWVQAEGQAIFEEVDGKVVATRYVGTIKDITAVMAQRLALEESERRLTLAITAARMAVWEFDVGTGSFTSSKQLKRLFGFGADAEPGLEEYRELHLPGEHEKVQLVAQQALESGERYFEVEYQIRRADGVDRWLLLRAEILLGPAGAPERVVGVVMDVDEQRRNAERKQILVNELNHRVKNSLAIVSALARQVFRGKVPASELSGFTSRMQALTTANEILLRGGWDEFSLFQLVAEVTAPFTGSDRERLTVEGVDVTLLRKYSEPVALVLHELATNAAKYGALSTEEGRVVVSSLQQDERILIGWTEEGGPRVEVPSHRGFGSKLLGEILGHAFVTFAHEFNPDGVTCRMELDATLEPTDRSHNG
jgi:PAS domain S-box-containing protein